MTYIQGLEVGQYMVQILTDAGGWMTGFVDTLKGRLEERGHSVMIASHIDDYDDLLFAKSVFNQVLD
jgi:hypothetical protein